MSCLRPYSPPVISAHPLLLSHSPKAERYSLDMPLLDEENNLNKIVIRPQNRHGQRSGNQLAKFISKPVSLVSGQLRSVNLGPCKETYSRSRSPLPKMSGMLLQQISGKLNSNLSEPTDRRQNKPKNKSSFRKIQKVSSVKIDFQRHNSLRVCETEVVEVQTALKTHQIEPEKAAIKPQPGNLIDQNEQLLPSQNTKKQPQEQFPCVFQQIHHPKPSGDSASKQVDQQQQQQQSQKRNFEHRTPSKTSTLFTDSPINEFSCKHSRGLPKQQQQRQLQLFVQQNGHQFNPKTSQKAEIQQEILQFWLSQTVRSAAIESECEQVQIPVTQTSQQKLSISQFARGKRLGKGMFGEVFVARHIQTGFLCAIKILSKQFVQQQKMEGQLTKEIKVHTFLNHPNVVQIYGYFADADNIYILQELCTGGQLYDVIVKRRRISENRAAYYVKQLAQGLSYLHTCNVVHRDIKPENILLQEGVIKICDFGWATHSLEPSVQRCGTPLYMAPEIIKGDSYSQKVDMWGLGLVTYQLIIGNIPWNIWTEQQIQRIVQEELTFPDYVEVSSTAQDFIKRALTKDPTIRISMVQSLTQPFLVDIDPMQYQNESFNRYGQLTP